MIHISYYHNNNADENEVNRIKKEGLHTSVQLLKWEHPLGNYTVLSNAINDNLWLITDIHLSIDILRTDKMIKLINAHIKQSDHLLMLGDMLDKHTGCGGHIIDFLSKLNTKNVYLVLGNNDHLMLQEYINMGFKYVTDKIQTKYKGWKVLFTHCPVPVNKDEINIHGHLHGANDYWHMTADNHIDVYKDVNTKGGIDSPFYHTSFSDTPHLVQLKSLPIKERVITNGNRN